MGEDLPPFSGDTAVCAKCGGLDFDTTYAPEFYSCHGMTRGRYVSRYGMGREALVRDCRTCGFTWAEALATEAST